MNRSTKRDSNHTEICSGLRDAGCTVLDLSKVGGGAPDILVGRRCPAGWRNFLIEIKSEKGKLSNEQLCWHRTWGGQVGTAWTLEEALRIVELEAEAMT